jgi:hypothetical protein
MGTHSSVYHTKSSKVKVKKLPLRSENMKGRRNTRRKSYNYHVKWLEIS